MTEFEPPPETASLPPRVALLLEQGLGAVRDRLHRDELSRLARLVAEAAWQRWLARRTPDDNRPEHEFIVFANIMRIAAAEELSLSDRRVAAAFAFTHDSFPIRRITDQSVRDAAPEQKERLAGEKRRQRQLHMEGGAENARDLLGALRWPGGPDRPLLAPDELKRCVDLIAIHDAWKIDPPQPPPTGDRLALACLEGDVLWPLHPLGVLADLERPDPAGRTGDSCDPARWGSQLEESFRTILEFRGKWTGIPSADFVDADTIFRTREGHRLYSSWRRFWGLQGRNQET